MSIGIRGFSIGYDFYAPERSVCFHHYAVGKNAKTRNKVHHFWENDQYTGYVLFIPIIMHVVVFVGNFKLLPWSVVLVN
jgi:hypothetical protein